jgi:uncharacterized protein YkwD
MRPVRGMCRAIVFMALVLSATSFALILGWAQIPDQPAHAPSTQSATPAAPNSVDQKPSTLGVWHHFGENPNAPSPEPRQSGGWRHFGPGNIPPQLPRESPTRQISGLSHNNEMEQLMLDLVNRDRADPANTSETKGRAFPLRWNDRLAEVAREHSLDMLNQGYFAHQDLQGRSVAGRVDAAGMQWQAVGENIAIYTTVARAEAAFMNEPRFTQNHRANILNTNFTEVGIGIVQGPDGRLYITQDFYRSLSGAGVQ